MLQIVFNELSAAELSALPKLLQLDLLSGFQALPERLEQADPERIGLMEREGRQLYRYRVGDYRIYFEKATEGLLIHRVLHRNTIRDFLFRADLPMLEGELETAKQRRIWELVAEGQASGGASGV
jgi:mRNA-degrading endonuclease RelE of RelBE toxin-antitoxin system